MLKDTGRSARRLAYTGVALALIAYAIGAWDSPLIDRDRKLQLDLLTQHARAGKRREEQERILAESYWSRYADVAADIFFGREGSLGVWGAREHFDRHGRREGRSWPKSPPNQPKSAGDQR